ncbi:MobF family relaxase [Pseudofrankia sp. DC12]|uniref:MobF family relaxase n=1 Tax=Pseudofrankia sp. DC12 TaxID=683315 RepID=UPI0005F817B3|nr:MobF family relaxase [Pseudofrankia sp. DC12]
MIATVRVLRASHPGQVAKAARDVVAYVQGGQPEASSPLAVYYSRARAQGRARGAGAELVGLDGQVSALALERLLRGRHAVSGRPLLSAAGSAGRVPRRPGAGPGEADELLTLAAAARIAGVGPTYLRRLVSRNARTLTAATTPAGRTATPAGLRRPADRDAARATADDAKAAAGGLPAGQLAGVRGRGGQWLVRRAELERWCAQRVPPATVLGYDLVCSAPKSVSLLWAFGDDALRADVAAAMEAAVDATIGYLERHGVFGRVRGQSRHALGLAVASYLHDVSRSDEAHLHIHNIIINAVFVPTEPDDDPSAPAGGGEWRTIDGEALLTEVRTAGYVGAAVLRHELSARRAVDWLPVRNGVAEIAGFPSDLLTAFSTRHGEVMAEFTQLVAAGLEPSAATKDAAQRGSRAPKRVLADAEVDALQRDRLTATGWTIDAVRHLAPARPARSGTATSPPSVDRDVRAVGALFDQLSGADGLTARATTFTRRQVVEQVAAWAGDRLGADAIERLADRYLADARVVLLHDTSRTRRRHEPEALYTVEGLLTVEDTLLALCRQGQVAAGAIPRLLLDPGLLNAQLAAATAHPAAREAGPRLTDEQAELVRRLLDCGDLVRPAVGPAGTGKTEAMRVLTAILHNGGRTVLATAHGGRQAEELADRIEIPARVVASWLTLLEHTDDPSTVWPPGSVLIVDEATQVPTRDAEQLLRYATRTGTVLILLGDPAQLGSVSAGGWFTHLATHTPAIPALATVHRQAGPQLAPIRAALGALRADTPAATRAALDELARLGHVHLAESATVLLDRAVEGWYTERRQALEAKPSQATHSPGRRVEPSHRQPRATPAPRTADPDGPPSQEDAEPAGLTPARPAMVQMMAQYQRDVDTLNTAARALLTDDGTLTGPTLTVAGRQFRVGDEVITLTQAGHTLIPAGRPDSAYIRTGTVGIVTAVHLHDTTAAQAIEVSFPSKGTVRVPWAYLTHRFEDGRDGGLAHAYAITAAKAQGATMDTTRAVVPDDTTRAGLYVMLSRARTDLHAYLLRRDQLRDRDDDESWLPAVEAGPADGDPLDRFAERLARSRAERLATDHDPHAEAAHQLRGRHTLSELTAARLAHQPPQPADSAPASQAPTGPSGGEPAAPRREPSRGHLFGRRRGRPAPATEDASTGTPSNGSRPPHEPSQAEPSQAALRVNSGPTPAEPSQTLVEPGRAANATSEPPTEPAGAALPRQVLLRRAELAAEAAIRAAALADPPAQLLARIGPLPTSGAARATWDDAVAALAIHHARHQPAAPTDTLGPPPITAPDGRHRDPWLRDHYQAMRLAADWAERLPDPARAHFHHPDETVPRARAVAGLHALLDHGHPADRLAGTLAAEPVTDIRTGAAVLAHRVTDLCHQAHLDPAHYELPPPATVHHEWQRAFRLLHAAETHHLATRPTVDLAAERHALDQQLHQPPAAPDHLAGPRDPREIQTRLKRLDSALDRQTSHAVVRATHEPAGYLTGLLGPRPTAQPAATAWDDATHRIEHYRHHVLGLPYNTPATPDDPDPAHHALGPRPTDPAGAAAYDHALHPDPALDPQLPL